MYLNVSVVKDFFLPALNNLIKRNNFIDTCILNYVVIRRLQSKRFYEHARLDTT